MAYLENKNNSEKNAKKTTLSDVMEKFIPVQIMNMKVWPFLSCFNFYLITCSYRVLFDNLLVFFGIFTYLASKIRIRERKIEFYFSY